MIALGRAALERAGAALARVNRLRARREGHPPARRRARARAQRRRRHLRRRAPRPPRGDRGSDSVLTFDPHPVSVVAPQHTPQAADRRPSARPSWSPRSGVQELIVIPFDAEFAARPPSEFIDDVLVGALGARQVSVGENFRFGHRAQGDPRAAGAPTSASRPSCTRCSRSTARSSPRATSAAWCWPASVAEANRMLGAPFQLRGEVAARRRARPRARLPDRQPGPRRGARLPRPRRLRVPAPTEPRPAAVSIGVRPTFKTGRGELIEAYILDFDGDLYGSELRLEFLERLRGERRFDERRGADRADAPRRRAHARDRRAPPRPLAAARPAPRRRLLPSRGDASHHQRAQARDRRASSAPTSRTRATPRSRSRC